jgi:hypothetical protein
LARGFGLRFGERESEAQAQRRLERSRSVTTVAEPQAEARRLFGIMQMPLVTSALFAEQNRSGREGEQGRPAAGEVKHKSALVTAICHAKVCFGVDSPCFLPRNGLSFRQQVNTFIDS